jgi:hypothetical protein
MSIPIKKSYQHFIAVLSRPVILLAIILAIFAISISTGLTMGAHIGAPSPQKPVAPVQPLEKQKHAVLSPELTQDISVPSGTTPVTDTPTQSNTSPQSSTGIATPQPSVTKPLTTLLPTLPVIVPHPKETQPRPACGCGILPSDLSAAASNLLCPMHCLE